MPWKKNRGRTKLLGNRQGYSCTSPDKDGKRRIDLMLTHVSMSGEKAPAHAASLNKRPKTHKKSDECFVLQTRFKCMIPRGRLPPSVCLILAVSTAAHQDGPSTRFDFPPSKYRHSRERQQGRRLKLLRPCATSGTNQTKKNVSSKY